MMADERIAEPPSLAGDGRHRFAPLILLLHCSRSSLNRCRRTSAIQRTPDLNKGFRGYCRINQKLSVPNWNFVLSSG
jgi:hypothetical protein